jgi:hypothetical protein
VGNSRFAFERNSLEGEVFAEGDLALVLLDSLHVGAFDEPGKGEILLSFSFSTFPAAAGALEPAIVLKEIGLPRLKNRTEVDWLKGVVLFGPAPVHRALTLTASVLEIDRGDTAARRVDAIAGFAGRLAAPTDTRAASAGVGILGSFLELVNTLNADDLVLQESETFLTSEIEGVPRLREGRIAVVSGHAEPPDRTRMILSVRRIPVGGPRRSMAAVGPGRERRNAPRPVRFPSGQR